MAFDAAFAGEAAVRHRESTRLVSCTQTGAGAWVRRLAWTVPIRHSSELYAICSRSLAGAVQPHSV